MVRPQKPIYVNGTLCFDGQFGKSCYIENIHVYSSLLSTQVYIVFYNNINLCAHDGSGKHIFFFYLKYNYGWFGLDDMLTVFID